MSTDRAGQLAKWRVLRLSAAVAGGLTLTTVSGSTMPGLAPVLALQLLLAPRLPGLRMGLFLVALVIAGTAIIHAAAIVFVDRPQILALLLALLFSLGFLFHRRWPVPALLFLITSALVPVWMAQTGGRGDLFLTLVKGVPVALLIAWIIDFLLPSDHAPAKAPASPPRPAAELSPAEALLKGVIILPVQLFYIQSPSAFSLAGLVTLIIILTLPSRAQTIKVLAARVVGNIIGGVAAAAAFALIYLQWTALLLFLVALLGSLLIAARLVRGGDIAPIMSLALVAFTLLLGVAVSEQLGGEPVDLPKRIVSIALIAAYGVGMSSLLRGGYAPIQLQGSVSEGGRS